MNRIKISPLATKGPVQSNQTPGDLSNDLLSKQSQQLRALLSPETERLCAFENNADAVLGQDFPQANESCSLFVPLQYEKNYAYPLIVWLHSDGQNASQLQKTMLEISHRNYVGTAVQSFQGNERSGYFWDQEFETFETAHESVMHAIDLTRSRLNINADRVFLAGAGSGGTMAFRLAFQSPEMFAGVISINGALPEEMPFCNWESSRLTPVYWAQGRKSQELDESQLCQQLRLLHIAGFSVTLRQYPMADLLCPKPLSDVDRWIMESIGSSVL